MIENFYNVSQVILDDLSTKVQKLGGSEFLSFGNQNHYPNEIFDLFKSVSSLRTLIEGSSILSSSIFSSPVSLDFNKLFQYLYLHGQCPILIRQSRDGHQFFLTPLDPRFVRCNADASLFAYSETDGFKKRVEYPAYSASSQGSSILFLRLNDLQYPYSLPIWSSASREVQILSRVSQYHNAQLENGFNASALINFNNGIPSTEDKSEIERLVQSKFGGSSNAGRILLSFNNSKEEEASITPFSVEDTSSRYMDLVKSCKEALYSAFRASSQLFGAPDGSETALTENEYSWKLSLFIRFTIAPIANIVFNALAPFGVTMKDPSTIVESIKTSAENE